MFEPNRSTLATKEPNQASESTRRAAVKPEYLTNEVRISLKGQEGDAHDRGDGSMEIPKNGREQGKGKVDS